MRDSDNEVRASRNKKTQWFWERKTSGGERSKWFLTCYNDDHVGETRAQVYTRSGKPMT